MKTKKKEVRQRFSEVVSEADLIDDVIRTAKAAANGLIEYWSALRACEKAHPGYEFGDSEPDVIVLLTDCIPAADKKTILEYLDEMSVEFYPQADSPASVPQASVTTLKKGDSRRKPR